MAWSDRPHFAVDRDCVGMANLPNNAMALAAAAVVRLDVARFVVAIVHVLHRCFRFDCTIGGGS